MALDTFDNLSSSIVDWSKRTDIENFVPDFIALAEKRIDKKLRTKDNEVRATLPLNTNDRFCVLPNDFVEMRSLRVLHNSNYYHLDFRTPRQLDILSTAGMPSSYVVTSKIELNRIPDLGYTLEMEYYSRLTPLSEANQTNNVLTNHPELYLYGALAEMSLWSLDEQKASGYLQLFDRTVTDANYQELRGRYGPSPAMRSAGVKP